MKTWTGLLAFTKLQFFIWNWTLNENFSYFLCIQCMFIYYTMYIIHNWSFWSQVFLIKMLKSGRSKRAQISPWRSYPERNWNQSFTFLQICKFAKLRPGNSCWLSLLAPSPNNLQQCLHRFQLKRKHDLPLACTAECGDSNLIRKFCSKMQQCWSCGGSVCYQTGFPPHLKVGWWNWLGVTQTQLEQCNPAQKRARCKLLLGMLSNFLTGTIFFALAEGKYIFHFWAFGLFAKLGLAWNSLLSQLAGCLRILHTAFKGKAQMCSQYVINIPEFVFKL